MKPKLLLFALIVILTFVDALVTEHLIKWPIYREGNPAMAFALQFPGGMLLLKTATILIIFANIKIVTTPMLKIITMGMSLVVGWNVYLLLQTI
tara:strand:+ start:241 stop:522 length:282 start_codon:yes stop_codon:yes gene_type:complete